MQKIFWALIALLPLRSLAQVSDNFSDGDFTSTPIWVADNVANWIVQDGKLRSNSLTASSTFYIVTSSTVSSNVEWGFLVNLQFNTSGANYVDVYLMSEQADLTNPVNNGYFVRIGGTVDEISLNKMVSGTPSVIINGADGTTNTSNNSLRIKVSRDASDQWTLSRDLTGGTEYIEEGNTTDNTFTSFSYFGIRITQSVGSFHQKHFFDDVYAIDPTVDTQQPTIVSTSVVSSTQLELEFSEEIDDGTAETSINYTVNTVGNASSAEVQDDNKTVLLTFADPFPNADTSRLTVINVQDLAGNTMQATEEAFFFFEATPAAKHDLIFTEIFADPTPSIGLPDAEYVEIFNRSNKIFNLAGWKYKDATTEKTLPLKFLRPGEYAVFVNSSSALQFASYNNVLSISTFPALTNTGEPVTLRDDAGLLIDSVSFDDDWHTSEETKAGGHSLERISYENFCREPAENWTSSHAISGGTPGEVNSTFDNTPDTTAPVLTGSTVSSSTEVLLLFNEKLSAILPASTDFQFYPEVSISSVDFSDAALKSLRLVLSEQLIPSTMYTLTANNVFDCAGNSIIPGVNSADVVLPEQAQQLDIIITEIFADPSPVVGLPEGEFIEIYNRSEKVIDLQGFTFTDGSSTGTLPPHLLHPNEYAILTSATFKDLYAFMGATLNVANFPSLNNAGESVVLRNDIGTMIDSIRYATHWYHDEDKQAGGWTLERRDLNNFCLEEENWRASNHASGGTPGMQNTVFTIEADSEGPILQSVTVISETEMLLTFNENLGEFLPAISNFSVQPLLTLSSLAFGESRNKLVLTLSQAIQPGVVYQLFGSNIFDCSGNETPTTTSVSFGAPTIANTRDVIISEIMPDPSPIVGLPEAEYIELYNRTNNWINLNGWKVIDATDTTTLADISILPHSFLVLTNNTASTAIDTLYNIARVSDLISLSNAGELIVLQKHDNTLIDSVHYSSNWFGNVLKKEGGWALERIDPDNFCSEENQNWSASIANIGGTPGTVNSIDGAIADSEAPTVTSVAVQTPQAIMLSFNEKVASSVQESFFELEPVGVLQTAAFTNSLQKQVLLTFTESLLPSTPYTLAVSQLQDCAGNATQHSVQFVLTEEALPNDVLISEIMADPTPVIGLPDEEYIELVNRSTKFINLNGWRIIDGVSEVTLSDFVLAPGQYAVLSAQAESFQLPENVLDVPNLPSLTNSGESISLVNTQNLTIDSVHYNLAWYQDENKQQGGWSLERRDLQNFCLEDVNWTASVSTLGGTPGSQNSVFTTEADTVGPRLTNAIIMSSTEVKLQFDEKLSVSPPEASDFIVSPFMEIVAISFGTNNREIIIQLSGAIDEGVVYEVKVLNISDCSGNMTAETVQATFGIKTTASFHDVIVSEIMADPSPSAGLPETEYIELYNRTNKWIDLSGWKITDATDTVVIPAASILPNSYVTLISTSATLPMDTIGNPMRVPNFISLSNTGETITICNQHNERIDSLQYSTAWLDNSKRDGGWSMERIDLDDFCSEEINNWKASVSTSGGTPGTTNSINGVISDAAAPVLVSLTIRDSQSLLAIFNEKIANELQPSFFESTPPINLTEALSSTDRVVITLHEAFARSTVYTFSISGLKDCAGNEIDTTAIVVMPEAATQGDILISEIMIDPSPTVELPDEEFIELVNRSGKYIDLTNWKVRDESTEASLPTFVLAPDQYVVLSAHTTPFEQYGAVLHASLPSLTNSGKSISIVNEIGTAIDSIRYDLTWYGDEEKQQGGWSLERRDLENFCIENANWTAAENEVGGTPGQRNSVFTTQADSDGPLLQTATTVSATEILLHFNEKLDSSLPDFSNYIITPSVNVNAVSLSNSMRDILLTLNESLVQGVVYQVKVLGIADCSNNVTAVTDSVNFGIPAPGGNRDVVISEIMADPSPAVGLPEMEYVELYNRTDNWINIDGWKICDENDTVVLSNISIFPHSFAVLIGSSASAYADTLANVTRIPHFMSLNNSGEKIAILDHGNKKIDEVAYFQTWLEPAKRDGGWSLERIDPDDFCVDQNKNWKASRSPVGGTPGQINSTDGIVDDFDSPALIFAEIQNDTEILLVFNERVVNTLTPDSFEIEPVSPVSEVFFTDSLQKQILIRFSSHFQYSTLYTIDIAGIQDCVGNAGDTTVSFVLTETPDYRDILISEIMVDPAPVIGLPDEEFVELFNRSEKYINLNDVLISDGASLASIEEYMLEPGQYVVLAVNKDFENLKNVAQANLPPLTNSGKSLSLVHSSGRLIDSLHYHITWYRDENKQQGGWSLERRDLNNFCLESENWMASTDEQGGTPGRQNSVFTVRGDTIPPKLLNASVLSTTQIELYFSEKLDDATPAVDYFQTIPLIPVVNLTAHLNEHTVVLNFESELQSGAIYEIKVSDIGDCSGNLIDSVNNSIVFGIPMAALPHDVIINEIMADPSPVVALPEAEYVEIYNRTNRLLDISSWTFSSGNDTSVFSFSYLLPFEFRVISNSTSAKHLSEFHAMELPNFPNLDNNGELLTLSNKQGVVIDSIRYQNDWHNIEKRDGGWSLERIYDENFCAEESSNWRSSDHPEGGTPASENLMDTLIEDVAPPQMLTAQLRDTSQLIITFSEKIASAISANQIFIDPPIAVESILFENRQQKTVLVTLASKPQPGIVYKISTSELKDCFDNINPRSDTSTFVQPEYAEPSDIIITEILADPTPVVGLPETEYIELFNRSNKFIDLKNFSLSDGATTAMLPSYLLAPNEYAILTREPSQFPNSVALMQFPSINNDGDRLKILSAEGVVIDSVTFTSQWYKNEEKALGGWALERIDLNNFCLDVENWQASIHISGGTPGFQNSVYSIRGDTVKPELLEVIVLSGSELLLTFNKKLSEQLPHADNIIIESASIQEISFVDLERKKIHALLSSSLQNGSLYSLTITEISDCSGNTGSNLRSSLFGLAAKASNKDVVVTEIMADPSPPVGLAEVEYVEVHNRSDKLIDLYNWTVSGKSIGTVLLLPEEYLLLCSPASAHVLSAFGKVYAVAGFPTLTNTGGAIVLRNEWNETVDSVNYADTWYKDSEKAEGGWSLELIDRNNICSEEQNWIVSEAETGGTPGKQNSVDGNKPDLTGPKLVLIAPAESELVMEFDEKMSKNPADFLFTLEPHLEISDVSFIDTSLKKMRGQVTGELAENTLYKLTADASDCAGNVIQSDFNSITFALPQEAAPGDVILNEVLFNPRPYGYDFVELYNTSAKFINLKNWSIGNLENDMPVNAELISETDFLLYPQSFLVITPDADNVQSEYPQSTGKPFLLAQLPPFNDDVGSIVLVKPDSTALSYFAYSDAMHTPLLKNKEGVSLERVSESQWRSGVAATNFATPGYLNANALPALATSAEVLVEPEIFEPVTGHPNFASIHYQFDKSGFVANAKVLDAYGRLVKKITNNEVLADKGFFTWDGDHDDGSMARIGYYTFWLEVFDTSGIVKTFRKRIVIASRF